MTNLRLLDSERNGHSDGIHLCLKANRTNHCLDSSASILSFCPEGERFT